MRATRGLGQPPGASTAPPYCGGIRPLQQMLSDLGYYAGIVDGLYGQNTENAMATFKREEGLGAGYIKSSDCDRLIKRWNAKQEPSVPPTDLPSTETTISRSALRQLAVRVRAPSAAADTKEDAGLTYAETDSGIVDKASAWWSDQGTVTKAAVIGGGVAVVGGTIYLMAR